MKLHVKENTSILIDIVRGFPQMLRLHGLTLVEKRPEVADIITFAFKPDKPITHRAGQYGLWFMPKFVKGKPVRFFSFASSPDEGTVQFSTRITGSDFKRKLSKLEAGDRMYVKGPIGRFVIDDSTESVVLVAGGIGIVAVRSILKDIEARHLSIGTTVIHSAKDGYLYQADLKQAADTAYFVERDTLMTAIETVVADKGAMPAYYAAGPPAFVEEATRQLRNRGITKVTRDGFLGY